MPSINDSKCVLVIGSTAGIGRALALAIHNLPTKPTVIVSGRRQERLDEIIKGGKESDGSYSGRLHAVRVDVSASNGELKAFVEDVVIKFPEVCPDDPFLGC